ncbi:MAG TPA: helix-hairpin-helix domain-containing protein [Bacteroidia bacterium]|nr:helix-hairpin-helix domain-containing protein [Bacteroidia bacterium]
MRLNKWKYLFKSYFTYTRREQNAIVVLLVLIGVLQLSLIILHWIPQRAEAITIPASQKLLAPEQSKVVKPEIASSLNSTAYHSKEETKKIEFFKFNPNHLPLNDWQRLGLSEKQAAVIHRWEAGGGSFRCKKDVKKMIVISEHLFTQLYPYIDLPENISSNAEAPQLEARHFEKDKYPPKQRKQVNINTATEAEFDSLPLIGEGRAKAMVKYREKLGGYLSVDQLKEIKCLPDSVLNILFKYVITDGKVLKKINLNSQSIDSLMHPYMPKPFARLIVNYTQQHGKLQSVNDLSRLPLYDEEILRKLAPYLTVNP